jgi:hypothetical protein
LRYLRVLIDPRDGTLSYFELWRALKSLNLRTFNLNSRELEYVIIQLCKMKERADQTQQSAMEIDRKFEFSEDLEEGQEDKFKRQLKNELEMEARQANGGKVRVKNSIVNKYRGTNVENLGLKRPWFKAKFSASDFVLIIISLVFRVVSQLFSYLMLATY